MVVLSTTYPYVVRVLVACEFSGTVREEFAKRGHDAMSCDFLKTEIPGKHYCGDVMDLINDDYDLLIAHPPCTHLAVSGARYFRYKQKEQTEALDFVQKLMYCQIPRIAVENPVSIISSRIRKPDQIIQPWQFGEDASKRTCLWLKNLPELKPTNIITKDRYANQTPGGHNNLPESKYRAKLRSVTYSGIARAMAEQWGGSE